jgi:V/A-type H+-transporting ATPase subunit I
VQNKTDGEQMLYPEQMTQIELVVPEQHVLAVTRALAGAGTFHQTDASYLSAEVGLGAGDDWRQRSTTLAALERQLLNVMKNLKVEEGVPPVDLESITDVDLARSAAGGLEQQVQDVIEDKADEQQRLEQLQSYVQQLEPIADIDVEVTALCQSDYVFSLLGTMPIDNMKRLQTSLARIPFVLLPLRQDNRRAIVILSGPQQHADVVQRAARSAYLNPLSLPEGYLGSPREIIDALRADVERVQKQINEQEQVITKLRDTRQEQLQTLLWRVRAGRVLTEALARYGKLRYTYLIVGWVPTSSLAALSERFKRISDEILVETYPSERGRANSDVPVALKNPGILSAFQQLVTAYGRPRYGEIDPTLLLALTFPLLFGTMFGDVGHGLVLALLGGLLASRKVRRLRGLADLGTVIAVCGLVSIVFGFLYGSIFGIEDVLPALWMRPMENIMQILIVTIAAGIVLLTIGFIAGMINAWVSRDWSRLFFDHNGLAGFLLYWSLLGLAATLFLPSFPIPYMVFVVSAAISGLVVMFSDLLSRLTEGQRPLIEGGLATYAIQVVVELFETLISFLSNTLSYVRVGAFAVAHGGLSAVIFILAAMVGSAQGVGYWIVVALGSLFIVGFEGMIVGIQTLRLEYYEFFSKFFTGGGAPYVPLVKLPDTGER